MKQVKNSECHMREDFLGYLGSEAERWRQNGHLCLSNNYRSAGSSFARFLRTRSVKNISFAHLTPLLIADYEAWLQVNGLCKNTTSFYIRVLHAAYNKAVRRGLTDDRRPFDGVYRGVARTVKRAIAPTDVCRLRALDIRSELAARGYAGPRLDRLHGQLEFARDIFLFSFCARGLTFVDLAYLQKSNVVGDTLVYVRRKTKQRIEVQVEPMMRDIIERHPSPTPYLLPILTRTGDPTTIFRQYRYALARYNRHLDMLGNMLGGLKLTSYVSRHSWASAAHQQHVPLSVISQSMGHDSLRTTEIYLKSLECNVIDQINHALLAKVFRSDGGNVHEAFGG